MAEYLKYFPKPFLDDLTHDRCLPFVGAGFSLNATVPEGKKMLDWEGLGKAIAKALPDYHPSTALEAISAYGHEYSRAKLIEAVSGLLLVDIARPGEAHMAFCRLPFDEIVTTNFDFLLEQTYGSLTHYCLPVVAEEQLSIVASETGVQLLKLHGDFHHPARMVVTEEDYDAFLTNFPLLATHLSGLLIRHTALFVGYSLDDPDFRQIWYVVKQRLGTLRRPAYSIQVGASPNLIARFERRGVKVINLPQRTRMSYGETLTQAFSELLEYWNSETIRLSTATEAEPQAEFALPFRAPSRLAFFSVPTRLASYYRKFVYPLAEDAGFSPVMAVDVVSPGDAFSAKISALLEKSAIVVADLGSSNTNFEVSMLLSRSGGRQKLIAIAEEGQMPSDLAGIQFLNRPRGALQGDESFLFRLKMVLDQFAQNLSGTLEGEAERLYAKAEYRAAVIAAFTQVEHELRTIGSKLSEDEFSISRLPMIKLLNNLARLHVVSSAQAEEFRKYAAVRNQLVHSNGTIGAVKSREILDALEALSSHLKLHFVDKTSI